MICNSFYLFTYFSKLSSCPVAPNVWKIPYVDISFVSNFFFCLLTVINMATVRDFDVNPDKFNIDGNIYQCEFRREFNQ
jgi:hypothetical protein